MSLNFSQNSDYIRQQGNFGASNLPMPETLPESTFFNTMTSGMGLPSTGDEFVKWSPHFLAAIGLSKFISDLAVKGSSLNPLRKGNEALNVADTYSQSGIAKMSRKIDNFLLPHINKHSAQISAVNNFFKKYTPDWVKNLYEQFKIGVAPKSTMALGSYKGCTVNAAESFLNLLKELPESEQVRLGVNDIISKVSMGERDSVLNAVKKISSLWANRSAKELQAMSKDRTFFFNKIKLGQKSLNLVNELNKAKSLMGAEARTPITKGLQKLFMYASEGAGGGVIGGGMFGLIMNSVFLASTIKRTWDAPWGEKLSTFMEGALVEFCGGYLMMILGSRLTYKLLGLKNADKSVAQIKDIKALTQAIDKDKIKNKAIEKLLKTLTSGKATSQDLQSAIALLEHEKIPINTAEEILSSLRNLNEKISFGVNNSIDKLAKMRSFQKAPGKILKNIVNAPIRWIGNFLSTGLENMPTKIITKDMSFLTKLGIKFKSLTNALKFGFGYPLRFILIMFFVLPPLTKLMGKISHTLFGKPTKSIMDEREGKTPDNKEPQTNPAQAANTQDKMQTYANIMKEIGTLRESQQPTQLPPGYNPQISQTLVDSVINTQRQKLENKKSEPRNLSPATYIPSPIPTRMQDSALIEEYNRKMNYSEKLGRHVEKELDAVTSNKDLYQF